MTPTKIVLEKTATHYQLKVFAPQTAKGYFVKESVQIVTGKSLDGLRKEGIKYAKRFGIQFSEVSL